MKHSPVFFSRQEFLICKDVKKKFRKKHLTERWEKGIVQSVPKSLKTHFKLCSLKRGRGFFFRFYKRVFTALRKNNQKKRKILVKSLLTKISEMVYNHLRLSLRFNAFRRHCYLKLRGKEKNKNSQKVEKTFRLKVLWF